LRLETAFKIDKKKIEKQNFIFHREQKIFLTRKEKHTCPRENKKKNSAADFAVDLSVTGRNRCGEVINPFASRWRHS
jgi:hypothetical protein